MSSVIVPPMVGNYPVCGQYPGAVPAGATVSMQCRTNLPPARYVIAQFPSADDFMNFCELDVCAYGIIVFCIADVALYSGCLLYTSPSPRDS